MLPRGYTEWALANLLASAWETLRDDNPDARIGDVGTFGPAAKRGLVALLKEHGRAGPAAWVAALGTWDWWMGRTGSDGVQAKPASYFFATLDERRGKERWRVVLDGPRNDGAPAMPGKVRPFLVHGVDFSALDDEGRRYVENHRLLFDKEGLISFARDILASQKPQEMSHVG